jgi:hypothetical protein
MSDPIIIDLPIKTGAGLNDRLHWVARSKKTKAHRQVAHCAVLACRRPYPAIITLMRISAGRLDSDNLAGAFKAIRDGVADAYQLPDNDRGLDWRYAQEKCRRGSYGIRIMLEGAA